MQNVDLPTSFTKLNENCGLPDIFTDYQIRHLGNPSGLPEILLKIDPWCMYVCMYKLYFPTVKTWLQKVISPRVVWLIKVSNVKRRQRRLILELFSIPTRWRIHLTLVPTRVCTWWRTWCPSCSASYGLTSRHSKTVENPSRLASHPRSPWLPRWASLTSYSSRFPSVGVTPVIRRSVVRLLFVSIAPVVGPFSPHLLFLRLSWQSFAVVVLVFCNLLVFLCLKSFQ